MELKEQKRCMGCMKPLDWDERCSNCGFDKNIYPNDPHYLPLGTLLKNGEYMVGRVLGEGGFGITYIGFDKNLLSRVAIKEYYLSECSGRNTSDNNYTVYPYSGTIKEKYEKGLSAFLEEARILAQFGGMEGIVNVRNLFQENGTAYIIMEYVEGVSVRHYVQEHGKISPNLVLDMMEQPIRALQAIHEKQLVHRDVSADNFLIRQNGKLTLIDFGAARYSNAIDNQTRTAIYKQGFSAIEQFSGKGRQGPWTDVYGICATMYYMMTGIVPQNATERAVDDEVIPLQEMQELLLDIEKKRSIMMGMAVKSKERFQNMAVLYYSIYKKTLTDNIEGGIFELKSDKQEDRKPPQITGMLTGMINDMLQNINRQKSQKQKKKIVKYVAGIFVIVISVLLFLNLEGYIGQADKNVKEPVNTPFLSASPSSSPVSSEPVKKDVVQKEESQIVKMPEVTGNKREVAVKKIKKAGLQCKVVKKYSNLIAKDKVIRTSILAGESVKKGEKIILYISKGKKKVTPTPIPTSTPSPTDAPTPTVTHTSSPKTDKSDKGADDNMAGDLDPIIY